MQRRLHHRRFLPQSPCTPMAVEPRRVEIQELLPQPPCTPMAVEPRRVEVQENVGSSPHPARYFFSANLFSPKGRRSVLKSAHRVRSLLEKFLCRHHHRRGHVRAAKQAMASMRRLRTWVTQTRRRVRPVLRGSVLRRPRSQPSRLVRCTSLFFLRGHR